MWAETVTYTIHVLKVMANIKDYLHFLNKKFVFPFLVVILILSINLR